jgi:5-formyltetrahydrofolate cyclo-ligase
MNDSLAQAKSALRDATRARLKTITPERRAAESVRLCGLLIGTDRWQAAATILLFAPLTNEPDLWPLLTTARAAGKTVALPRFDSATQNYRAARIQNPEADLVTGAFSIREPAAHCPEVPLNRLDLVLVPGVAFDAQGWRLGRGKGFYDRLLAQVCGTTCGVAFDEQIVETIPVEPHDVRLTCILTPTRLIET